MNQATLLSMVERKQDPRNLAWLDLEMTGLNVNSDVILQAALIVTDADLNVLEEYVCDIWQSANKLALMGPYVRDMHTKTGLLTRLADSRMDVPAAESELLERVSGWCPYGAVLCGNTIGQDRKFIDRYMPGLGSYLTYRMIDVSSLKLLAKLWYGPSTAFTKPSAGAHDALVDIKNSIAELAHYRKQLFLPQA